MPAFGQWDSQRKDSVGEKDEQPPKTDEGDEKQKQAPDASNKDPSETGVKTEERPQEPAVKASFDANRSINFPPPSFESDKKDSSTFNFPAAPIDNRTPMPSRVDPYPMRRYEEGAPHYRRPASPQTMTHSPSTSVSSLDRGSAVSTPSARRSPPHNSLPAPHSMYAPYPHDPMMARGPPPQHHYRPELPHAYMYAPPPPPPHHMDHRPYEHGPPPPPHDGPPQQSPYHQAAGVPPHMVPPMHVGPRPEHYAPYPHPNQQGAAVYTDDAATKLSDRVRRRCFNCCTTDTSTWRRSNLSPGKVLCNKCGLFERTHSRPRPEQFPHKRGPLSTSTLSRRTSPGPGGAPPQLPPLSPPPPFHYGHPPPPHHYPPPHHNPRDFPSPQQSAALPGLSTWSHQQHHQEAPPPPLQQQQPHTDSPKSTPMTMGPPSRRATIDNGAGAPSGSGNNSASHSRGPTPPVSRPGSAQQQPQQQEQAAVAA